MYFQTFQWTQKDFLEPHFILIGIILWLISRVVFNIPCNIFVTFFYFITQFYKDCNTAKRPVPVWLSIFILKFNASKKDPSQV